MKQIIYAWYERRLWVHLYKDCVNANLQLNEYRGTNGINVLPLSVRFEQINETLYILILRHVGFYSTMDDTHSNVVGLMLIFNGSLPDSNLFAIVTLCPKRQYLGIFLPTIPARTVPVCKPILI